MATIAKKVKLDNAIRLDFEDGKTKLEAKLSDFNDEIVKQLALHGLSQKLGDSYSGIKTVAEAILKATGVYESLKSGEFNVRTQGSSILSTAVARLRNITVDEARDFIAQLDEETYVKLTKNARVKAMVDVVKGELATTKLEGTDDDLDELF